MEKNNLLSYVIIGMLIVVLGLLLFENHQIDTIKHAVGANEESSFELGMHKELTTQPISNITLNEKTEHSEE